ncbi:DUF4118 domain-containing protein [Bradyrhizobium sp. SZCCHNS3053]|uniref:DUF4118 domain-containing protein n=1 Tax=Bradyrhizobium sp. SZCCHNS3053 TaxID=3057322 RepID=UPI002915E83A|nr:DUF4118 domain-containing protein [Bradyrhizobium sp. SZCCHNS3053]
MTTIYRNYRISKVGDRLVATSADDDCLLTSRDQRRLLSAIDELWVCLERAEEPYWFSSAPTMDLDAMFPERESAASESDPPGLGRISLPMFLFSAVVVAAPLSYFMAIEQFPQRADVVLTLGVCAVAVAFGARRAMLCSVVAALVYNFFVVEPMLEFTLPSEAELLFTILNLGAAVGLPALLRLRDSQPRLGRDRTPGI